MSIDELAFKIPEDGRIWGTKFPRPSAIAKVTGTCDYGADLGLKLPEDTLHLALVHGEIDPDKPVMVRVHMENPLCDVLASTHGCGWPLRGAMKQIVEADEPGVIVVLRQAQMQDARHIVQWMVKHPEPEKHDDAHPEDLRTHGVGAQILMDLNVHKMRLMSAPKRIHGLAGFGLEVVDYVKGTE